jgi:hypothetical protein
MKTLAYKMSQFEFGIFKIPYWKALSFLQRRSEAGDPIFYGDVSLMVGFYWQEV